MTLLERIFVSIAMLGWQLRHVHHGRLRALQCIDTDSERPRVTEIRVACLACKLGHRWAVSSIVLEKRKSAA